MHRSAITAQMETDLQDGAINAIDGDGAGIVVECQCPASQSILHFTCGLYIKLETCLEGEECAAARLVQPAVQC